eukprot:Gb_38005 [translate_table: standard]
MLSPIARDPLIFEIDRGTGSVILPTMDCPMWHSSTRLWLDPVDSSNDNKVSLNLACVAKGSISKPVSPRGVRVIGEFVPSSSSPLTLLSFSFLFGVGMKLEFINSSSSITCLCVMLLAGLELIRLHPFWKGSFVLSFGQFLLPPVLLSIPSFPYVLSYHPPRVAPLEAWRRPLAIPGGAY